MQSKPEQFRLEYTLKLNNNTTVTRSGMIMLPVTALILLQACGILPHNSGHAGSGTQGRVITVASNPPGATIRANGNKLGETPLEVDIDKSFSRGWVKAEDYGVVYRMNGTLTIEKSGCDDYTLPVTETAPSDDIRITLVCTEEQQTTRSSEPVTSEKPGSVELRLKKLEKLYREGAISTDEYNQHRNRILGEI